MNDITSEMEMKALNTKLLIDYIDIKWQAKPIIETRRSDNDSSSFGSSTTIAAEFLSTNYWNNSLVAGQLRRHNAHETL